MLIVKLFLSSERCQWLTTLNIGENDLPDPPPYSYAYESPAMTATLNTQVHNLRPAARHKFPAKHAKTRCSLRSGDIVTQKCCIIRATTQERWSVHQPLVSSTSHAYACISLGRAAGNRAAAKLTQQ